MKLYADDLQLGAKTHSELRTTPSPPGAMRLTGSEGKCYAINLNPAPFTIRSLPVHNSAQPGSSPHNILHNLRGEKKTTNNKKTCTKAVRQTVSCIMKQAQGYVSKDNWDLQAVQVYRMNLFPMGRFPHWYFRRMRKPLKITLSPTLPPKGCLPAHSTLPRNPLLTCKTQQLRVFKLFEASFFFFFFSTDIHCKKNAPRPPPCTFPGRAGSPSAPQHSHRIAGNSLSFMPYT